MYRIAVCDDDKNIREQVKKNDSGMEVSGGGKGVFFRKGADGKLPALRTRFS